MVQSYEIIASSDHFSLISREFGQSAICDQLCHLIRVLSKNNRIKVPCESERHGPIGSRCIGWARNIVWQTEANGSSQTDHTSLLGLIFLPVSLHSFSVRQDHVVGSYVWLGRVVATATVFDTLFIIVRASPWGMNSIKVTAYRSCYRLIQGEPVLHSVSIRLEDEIRIVVELIDDITA